MRRGLSDERENMEVDVLVLCGSDQQQRNENDILATIEGELLDDEEMSELATAESPAFDESRPDDGGVCQSDLPVTSPNDEEMLTPDERRPGGVAFASDNGGPSDDEPVGSSDDCVLPASLHYTTRSDGAEPREEETVSDVAAAAERWNSSDCAADACGDDSVTDVDCVVNNVSDDKCDPGDVSKSACDVTESYSHNTETVSDTRLLPDGQLESSVVTCTEMTSASSVIDTYAVVDQSDTTSDVDSALLVGIPGTETVNVTTSCSTDEPSVDNTQQICELSDEIEGLELIEAKKKGFRVRFHEDHVVTGYHDPPTPWREGWQLSSFRCISLLTNIITLHHLIL